MRVRLGAGTGVELIVSAMALADPDWRPVFTHGQDAYDAAIGTGGRGVLRDAARGGGRLGWVALLGPLTRQRGAWSADALRRLVADDPTRLRVIAALPVPPRTPSLTEIRRRLADVGPEQVVAEVAPGIHYGPGTLDDVVLVTSPAVAPIIIETDHAGRTIIVHPPLTDGEATDAGARLRDLGRALGDGTRMRVLQQLKSGDRSLPDLCDLLDSPRTTLLHHLALLRGAGLIDLDVTAGEANVYRLRAEGFEELERAARGFLLR